MACSDAGQMRSVTDGRWKFSLPNPRPPPASRLGHAYGAQRPQLYDLQAVSETTNLAADPTAVKDTLFAMNAKLDRLIAREIGVDDGSFLPPGLLWQGPESESNDNAGMNLSPLASSSFLRRAGAAAAGAAAQPAADPTSSSSSPTTRAGDVGFHGSDATPALDRSPPAAAYRAPYAQPMCTPSRAAMMTGATCPRPADAGDRQRRYGLANDEKRCRRCSGAGY